MIEELEILTSKQFDGCLGDQESRRLNELLQNEQCRRHYVELSKLDYCMTKRALSPDARRTVASTAAVQDRLLSLVGRAIPGDAAATTSHRDDAASQGRKLAGGRHTYWPMAAAALLMACGIGIVGSTLLVRESATPLADVQEPPQPIAQPLQTAMAATPVASSDRPDAKSFAARIVTLSRDASWDKDAGPRDFLLRLPVGERLKLARGVVKLELAADVFAVVTGPAEFEIMGPRQLQLYRGSLSGRSEEGDFSVQTPTAYVVDVGTAFAVSVDDRATTDVVVYEGEVHVKRTAQSDRLTRLTTGMTVRATTAGMASASEDDRRGLLQRDFNGERPDSLSENELSLVDVICGSVPNEFRAAGSIDPETGAWSTLPWAESKGVSDKACTGVVVPVPWNPWVHGVFLPRCDADALAVDLEGGHVAAPPMSGGAWGPIWARRKLQRSIDPLCNVLDSDAEGFWGAGTTTALFDRSRWVRDGVVGMHANVGITIDLHAIRQQYQRPLKTLRGVVAHLEKSHVSQPFHPQARTSFEIFVDGELRYQREGFCRLDGDAMFGADLLPQDRFLTLVVTDGGDGPIYDRVILLDPIIELGREFAE